MSAAIDFRWGMDSLDDSLAGGTHIPGFVVRHYAEVGVSVQEMMLIIHLSAFHYNSPHGSARPSLATIARLMGYKKDDSVRRMVKNLEKRKLLKVQRTQGKPSLYNFHGLTRACFALENSPMPVGDPAPPPSPPSHAAGGPPSHPDGEPGPPLDGGTPPHAHGDEEREQNENHQESEDKTPTPPALAPPQPPGDDADLKLVLQDVHVADFVDSLWTAERHQLLQLEPVEILAWYHATKEARNPAGLFSARFRAGESPPEAFFQQAREDLARQQPFHPAPDASPTPRAAPDASLTASPPGLPGVTWKVCWSMTQSALQLLWGPATYASASRAELVRVETPAGQPPCLVLRAATPMAHHELDRRRDTIARQVTNYAGVPVEIALEAVSGTVPSFRAPIAQEA